MQNQFQTYHINSSFNEIFSISKINYFISLSYYNINLRTIEHH